MSYTRSGLPYTFPRVANGVPFLGAASSTNGVDPVVLFANPTTHRLLVETSSATVSSAATNTGVTIGTSSTSILSSNASRKSATIVNDSTGIVYLSLSGTAVLNTGIRINASGGSAVITEYTGEITGIGVAGSQNVTVTEL